MKTALILKADLLDIIFDNRNKDYGAYPLRKYYHERLYKALGITFLFISILSLFIFLYKPKIVLTLPFVVTDITPGNLLPKKKITPPPVQKPTKAIAIKLLKSQIFTSVIKIVDSTMESTKLAKNLDSVVISNVSNYTAGNQMQIIKSVAGNESTNNDVNISATRIDKDKPAANAEFMPLYPGGNDELIEFLQKNLHNPQDIEPGETVSVKIKFIVGYDGVLKGFETVEDGGKVFNNEVIRVLKKMPAWIPGKTAGESVSVYYTIPVKFVSKD